MTWTIRQICENMSRDIPTVTKEELNEHLNFKLKNMNKEQKIKDYELLVTKLNNKIKELEHSNSMLGRECKFLKEIIEKLTNFN